MSYVCRNCGNTLDRPYCDQCNSRDHVVEQHSTPQASASGAATSAPSAPPLQVPSAPALVPLRPPAIQTLGFTGLAQIEAALAGGRRAIVLLGLSQSGKSQIVRAFIHEAAKHRQVSATETSHITFQDEEMGGTAPGTIWYQRVDIDEHRYLFVDPSGEDLNQLMPQVSSASSKVLASATIDPTRLLLLHKSVKKLEALVIVVDLHRAGTTGLYPWRKQEEQLSWLLRVMRWLRFDTPDAFDPNVAGNFGLIDYIDDRAGKVPKIEVPVLVLFSKADLLPIETTRQRPLRYARTHLPTLHAALSSHAKEFRYDCISTMHKSEDRSKDVPSDRPWGVFLSFEWLLFDSYRRFGKMPASWLMFGSAR